MSLNYINPKNDNNQIIIKLLESYLSFKKSDDNFFLLLNKLGSLLNVFYQKSNFSTTDCMTTNSSLFKLFDPINQKRFSIKKSEDLKKLFNNVEYNFFGFTLISTKLPYHHFAIIFYENDWYLLQSYTNICESSVFENSQIPLNLIKLLDTGDEQIYNELFGTSLINNNKKNEMQYGITAGNFSELPAAKLKNLILDYIKNNDY